MILIDPPRWPAHGRLFCHLVSDQSGGELHDFAARAGLPARAFDHDHYDVVADRYGEMVAAGAVPVPTRELLARLTAAGLRRPRRDRRGVPTPGGSVPGGSVPGAIGAGEITAVAKDLPSGTP